MKKFTDPKQIKESGHYWWLPQAYADRREDKHNWSVTTIVPIHVGMEKVGEFYGPLIPPIILLNNL